ncbi:PaREP1 family protein [Vulcanisaeta thermophila]|uniref:PaREP1 family protein n=1 Tax=Vulcanisaeta thermophila TaxID=867917 RepID=UPI000853B46E|nr:PaREP1 family protein [Vulcanisaeta thermophila]
MDLIQDAWNFLKAAKEEYLMARERSDPVLARDAAEKAWNAVVQAADALIMALLGRRPMSHRERRDALWMIEERYPELEGVYDQYNARFQRLHGDGFYEGLITMEDLEREIEKAEKFIKRIENYLIAGGYSP